MLALFKEMLLRLFYLYTKSPKKSAQLHEIVKELEGAYHYPKGLFDVKALVGLPTSEGLCNELLELTSLTFMPL